MADQGTADCTNGYSGGSLAGAIVGTFAATLLLLGLIYLVWEWQKKRRIKRSGLHNLVIVEDGGGGTAEGGDAKGFAYDNPGFIDESSEAKKSQQGGGLDAVKFNEAGKPASQQNGGKRMPWGPLSFLFKSRNALDDSVVEEPQRYSVALKGHDFTGLGFNIMGNMRDGIFVKDMMQRGPAAESKEVIPGDQITGMTVSFKQMVLEDAITLLSYASPYEVTLEMLRLPEKSMAHKGIFVSSPTHPSASSGQSSTLERVCHPFFKSQSIDDLRKVGKEHLDLQVDRKKKQANGIHASKGSDTPTTTATVSGGTMEIPTVVVVGNNENRSSSSTPSKSTSSAVKLPKLPKLSFSFGSSSSASPKSSKAPEAHQKSSASSSQIQIPIPDEVDGPIVSVTKPEVVPRSKTKATLAKKSANDMELVEAISPAIDKMTAEFEKSKKMKDTITIDVPSSSTAVLDVQPIEIDMKGQPSVKVESSGGDASANIDMRAPSMQMVMPGTENSKSKEGKKKEKKSSKQKSLDIDITPPSVSFKGGIEMSEGESKAQQDVKKPQRGQKSKDKSEKKEKEAKASKPEKEPKNKDNSKEQEQGESTAAASGEKSKFFKFGIPVLPDISFGFGGSKSSGEDKGKEKDKDKESKDKESKDKDSKVKESKDKESKVKESKDKDSKVKETKESEDTKAERKMVEVSAMKVNVPKVSLEVQQKSPELDFTVPQLELSAGSKNEKKEKEPKDKSKSKDKKKEKDKKESKSEQPASLTMENEDNQQSTETPPPKEKSGSSFSLNFKLPSFDKPLLKRKDSSGSASGEAGEKITVDSSPNASGAKDASDMKSPKDDKSSGTESSPSKSKKKTKAEKKSSSRPTSPEISDGHRTTDDEGEKSMDLIDSVPGEKSSKRGSGFHMPHIGIKLPKFGSSKQTYSFENVGENKHGHGPVAEALLEPSPSMKLEVAANTAEFKKMTPTVDAIVPEVTVKMDQTLTEAASEVKKVKDEVDSSEVKVEIETPTVKSPSVEIEVPVPSASMKLETTPKESSSVPSESGEKMEMVKAEDDEANKKDQDAKDKDAKEKESKPSFVSKGLKGLRDFKDKVAHRLSHDHQQASGSSSEEEGEPGDENKVGKEKVKKEKKPKESSQEKSKEEKQREKEEKLKEKERLKAEKKLKKAELKKSLSSGGQASDSSSSSSSDESDAEDGAGAKTEKKGKKKSKTKDSKSGKEKKSVKKEKKSEKGEKKYSMPEGIEVKADMPGIEVQIPEVTASSAIEQKQLSGHEAKLIPVKPPVLPRKSRDSLKEESESAKPAKESSESARPKLKKTKSKGGSSSSSSSSSSESDSENKKERKEGKPKKPKRSAKRKAPEVPHSSMDVPDVVKITTSAEVMSPPREETSASKNSGEGDGRESTPSKTPESGRRSVSFGDLSSLQQPKSIGDGPLERAMSMDMAGDQEQSPEPGTMPVGSSQEDLSVVPDSKTITHLTREQHHLQGLRDSMASNTSTSSNETLKASATSVVQVHPKEQQGATSAKVTILATPTVQEQENVDVEDPQSSTIQKMMNETLSVMNNIVHEMDSPSLVKSAMKTSSSYNTEDAPRVTFSTSESISIADKSEAEKVAQEAVDDIMEKASQSLMSEMSVSFGEREKSLDEPKVSVTTGDIMDSEPSHSLNAEMEGGADSFSIASVKIQGMDGDSDEPVSVRNITVTNIKSEPATAENVEMSGVTEEDSANKQLLREDSKQRLLQTVADANNIKVAPATPLRKDSSLSSSSCSVDSSSDTKLDNGSPLKPIFTVETVSAESKVANGKSNGQTIEISSEELDGIMMSHADFLQKQAIAGVDTLAQDDPLVEPSNLDQQLKDTFDSWVYVEQKNAAHEHTCPHSHSDPEPSTASSNDDDDSPYGRNGALSPTTYRMETEYKFETSEMRVTSSPIPPEDAQVKSQSTVYSTTMTLPQKTVTQITLGDPVIDAGGRIVSKITLDTSSQNVEDASNSNKVASGGNAEVDLGKLPNLETLK